MRTIPFWKKSVYSALIFFGALIVLTLAYAGITNIFYSDLPNVNSGSGLTATSWNNLVNYANKAVKQDSEVLTITGGKVGIGTTSPGGKLEVNGDLIRTIARAQGYWDTDDTDNGALTTRKLTFIKKQSDTGIRVIYTDGRRVSGASIGGRWEAKFTGTSCTNPGKLAWDIHSGASGDYHRSDTTIGTCFGLPAGTYTIQIYVGPVPGYGVTDLYTGWQGIWSLEAEEVR